ncbi:hypothetical protein V6238_01590 [Marinomonas arenicola]|uniref:hypothetical protein n=1 Tax=Marinomonas arenicola TaxID=569601 RepID=UPI00311DE439
MNTKKKAVDYSRIAIKVAHSVSFNEGSLAAKKKLSKARENYIRDVSSRAFEAVAR